MYAPLEKFHLQASNTSVSNFTYRQEIYDIDAPYQRGSVWGQDRQMALIKSLLEGKPIGSVILAEQPFGQFSYRVVDGKQRIEALWALVNGELLIPAIWVDPDSDPNEMISFQEANEITDGVFERKFENAACPTIFYNPQQDLSGEKVRRIKDPEKILQLEAELYVAVNTGGIDHTEEEILRAEGFLS